MKVFLFVAVAMMMGSVSQAETGGDWRITKVEIVELPDFGEALPPNMSDCNIDRPGDTSGETEPPAPPPFDPFPPQPFPGPSPSHPIGVIIEDIINIGRKVWDVVEMGRPSSNVQRQAAHALPKGLLCWENLSGWEMPAARTFKASFGGLNGKAVDFTFRLVYTYGGNYEGKGKYIANATMLPGKLKVGWGYAFDARVEVPLVFNQGTPQDPLAAMQMNLNWKISNTLGHQESTEVFVIRGDGLVKRIEDQPIE